jgi:hypothetical protein
MPEPTTFHFRLPPYQGPPLPEPPNAWYPGIQASWPRCTSDRLLRSDGRIRAFVIHATDGFRSVDAVTNMHAGVSSFHWLIPDEDEPQHGNSIWACVQERRAAWHVRNSRSHPDVNGNSSNVNYWSLGVELVNRVTGGGDPYSDWQIEQAAALVRYAWSKYPELRDVVSHAKLDPGRRSDPGSDFPWERFRQMVLDVDHAPTPLLHSIATETIDAPIRIISPEGMEIECDARRLDGVTVVEARPLIEALGFAVEYDDEVPMTMQIRRGPTSKTEPRAVKARGARSGRGGKKRGSK